MTYLAGSRTADAAKGLAALIAAVVLVVGVPAGLWAAVGWPLPDGVPVWSDVTRALSDSYVSDEFLINALAVVCWLAWAQLVAALAVETVAAARGRPALRIPLAGPLQTVAAHLVAAILLLAALAGPRDAMVTPPLATIEIVAVDPASTLLTAPAPPPPAHPSPAADIEAPASANEASPPPTYTVQRLDDLWSIAERHLADPYRWTDIWDLNRGRSFDGTTFGDPDLIYPGWTLDLPRDAIGLAPPPRPIQQADTPAQRHASPSDEPVDDEQSDAPSSEAADLTPGGTDTDQGRPGPTAPDATPDSAPTPGSAPPAPAATDPAVPPADADADTGGEQSADEAFTDLPSGAAVGLALAAAVSAALAAARLRRRRHYVPGDPRPGIAHDDPLAPAVVRRLRRAHLSRQTAANAVPNPADSSTAPTADPRDPQGRSLKPDLARLGALCLTGEGASDTTRAVLTTFLLADTPTAAGRVLIAGTQTAQLLLPGGAASPPGLDIADTLDAALTDLEVELITRTRLLDSFDVADFTTLAERHPEQPVPAVLLITQPPDRAARQRLDAVLRLGGRLGINAILLGPCDTWPTVAVGAGGTVTDVQPPQERTGLVGTRLDTLTVADATALLATATAAGDVPIPGESPELVAEDFSAPPPAAAAPPITVRLLGPLAITAGGAEIRSGLRNKARELLAYFLLHPQAGVPQLAAEVGSRKGV